MKSAEIHGIGPVEIVAHDMTSPPQIGSSLRLTVTNVLNRPVEARVSAHFTNLSVSIASQQVHLAANEKRDVIFPLSPASPSPQNVYSLEARSMQAHKAQLRFTKSCTSIKLLTAPSLSTAT